MKLATPQAMRPRRHDPRRARRRDPAALAGTPLVFAGLWLLARTGHRQAARAGVAAGLGFIVAIVAKLGISFAMLGIFAVAWMV
ncbi:hypothetical protein [Aromatoleum aromaticum]|uniref:hypothetical protein n=1 Tax=Aromatoleum aromaticum TaxID=551760 RepID=UPI0012FEDA7C|nr:hypothetical protein [Aromatoleum aromaticum]